MPSLIHDYDTMRITQVPSDPIQQRSPLLRHIRRLDATGEISPFSPTLLSAISFLPHLLAIDTSIIINYPGFILFASLLSERCSRLTRLKLRMRCLPIPREEVESDMRPHEIAELIRSMTYIGQLSRLKSLDLRMSFDHQPAVRFSPFASLAHLESCTIFWASSRVQLEFSAEQIADIASIPSLLHVNLQDDTILPSALDHLVQAIASRADDESMMRLQNLPMITLQDEATSNALCHRSFSSHIFGYCHAPRSFSPFPTMDAAVAHSSNRQCTYIDHRRARDSIAWMHTRRAARAHKLRIHIAAALTCTHEDEPTTFVDAQTCNSTRVACISLNHSISCLLSQTSDFALSFSLPWI